MQGPTSPVPRIFQQGVALVDLVIERVRANPYAIAGICRDYPLAESHSALLEEGTSRCQTIAHW